MLSLLSHLASIPTRLGLQVWHTDDRARIEAYTHWGIIGFAGLLVSTAETYAQSCAACSVAFCQLPASAG